MKSTDLQKTTTSAGHSISEKAARDEAPDSLTYWQRREEWERLGREVGALRTRAKADGVPLETLPGARALVARFKSLGQELDRRTR